MNGKEILIDTNIVLYLLNGSSTLEDVLQGKDVYLSFITELELIGFKNITAKEESQIKELLKDCLVIAVNDRIKKNMLKLEKSII